MKELLKYFADLSDGQYQQFDALPLLYREWNEQINVISRKDLDNLWVRHILHSLAIAKFIKFAPGSQILDLGTGGGFPGIPLAILFPDVSFHLIDGTRKKIKVTEDIVGQLDLKNVKTEHIRAEMLKSQYDFVLSRAVAPLEKLMAWTVGRFKDKEINPLPNGLICLKGGDLKEEINAVKHRGYIEVQPLKEYFHDSFFETKQLVYIPS